MIVSALVVTMKGLESWPDGLLTSDERITWGTQDASFLPIVTTTASLREARELFEQLSAIPEVSDLQLVSWFGEEAAGPPLDENAQKLMETNP